MGSRDKEHEAWNLEHGLKPGEHLPLVCPRCMKPHVETLTSDPSQPDYCHHVHQCTYCGLRFDLYVRTSIATLTKRNKPEADLVFIDEAHRALAKSYDAQHARSRPRRREQVMRTKKMLAATFEHPHGNDSVHFRCSQVSYSLRPEEILVGMKLGFAEHAHREFVASEVPRKTRFITATVERISNGVMHLKYDDPNGGYGLGVSCGVDEYARFCVPALVPVVKPRKPARKRKAK